ncbi:ribonuclease H-like domain-containing protein [Tanacetum coccineum]
MSEELTYSMLHEMMMKKFNLEANSQINLSFKLSSFDYTVDITDDAEVQFFVEYACNLEDEFVHLFVSERQNNQNNKFFNFFETATFENNSPSNQDINATHLNNNFNNTSVFNNGLSFDLGQNYFQMNESICKNEPYHTNPESSFAFRSNEAYVDENNDSDDGVDENPHNNFHKWNNFMSFMPEIPDTPVYKSKPIISKQYSQQSEVKKGNIFDNKEALVLAVRLKALNDRFQFLVDRSGPGRCELKCYQFNQCDWKLRARLWNNTGQYYITHLDDTHTCPKTQTYPNHRNANKKAWANVNSVKSNVNSVRHNVNSVRTNVNIGKPKQPGAWGTAVKTSAGYNWRRPRPNSNYNSRSNLVRTINVKGSQGRPKPEKAWDHLDDFEEYKRGSVTFGGSKGYITGKGRIRHKVLFTETECLVVSPDFKMPDENQILLKVPRQNNMYSFDMKTPGLTKDYACLIAKATSDESKFGILKNFIRQIENQLNHRVKIIRSDNGTEFKNRDMLELCGNKGIKQEYSNARTPQQNEVAERMNRTLIETTRTILADSLLPTTFWAEAVSTACYIFNRVRVTKPQNKTPYELLFGHKPIISYIRPFGCHVTILDTLSVLGKFDGKCDEGFLVGYSLNSKAFRMFDIDYLTDYMKISCVFWTIIPNQHKVLFSGNTMRYFYKSLIANASRSGYDECVIVVPTAIKHSAAKVGPRKSSTNSKEEKFLTELQNLQTQEKEAFSTGILEDTPEILAFRRDLDQLAQCI